MPFRGYRGFVPCRMQRFVFLLILSFHSPAGSESLLLLRQKKEPRKGDPEVTVAARLPCDARANGPGPKLGPQRTWASDIGPGHLPSALRFSASPTGVKFKNGMNAVDWRLAFDLGAPAAPPRSAGEAGGVRPLCLSRAAASLRAGPLCRAPQGTAAGGGDVGSAFLWLLSFAQAKESDSLPAGE